MAPTYLSPGVYVEEIPSASKPIEGVGTAVAAFVGFAEKGDFNTPVLVTNWSQFRNTFGDFMPGSYLAHAVYGYFNNGGGSAYVVRIGASDTDGEADFVIWFIGLVDLTAGRLLAAGHGDALLARWRAAVAQS